MRYMIETILRLAYSVDTILNVMLCWLFGDGPEVQRRVILNARRQAALDARICIRWLLRLRRTLAKVFSFDPIPWVRYDSIPAPGRPGHIVIKSLERISKWSMLFLLPVMVGIAWLDSTLSLGSFFALGSMLIGAGLVIGPLILCDVLKLTKGWRSADGW